MGLTAAIKRAETLAAASTMPYSVYLYAGEYRVAVAGSYPNVPTIETVSPGQSVNVNGAIELCFRDR